MNDDFELRFVWLRALAMLVLVVALCLAVVDFVGLAVADGRTFDFFLAALPAAIAVVLGATIFYGLIRLLISVEWQNYQTNQTLGRMSKDLKDLISTVALLGENTLLSERAKSIAFREKDGEAVRGAIEEKMAKEDWESARYLANQLGHLFGYQQEALGLSEKISKAQEQSSRHKLEMGLARMKDLLAAFQWDAAAKQIQALQESYPQEVQAKNLSGLLEDRRLEHKKHLLQQWDQAVNRNQIDHGIEILQELDQYLTANEVAALEESARGVFRAKLHNLGVRFSLMVAEKQWTEALEVGEEIIDEFPNSRMAQEIRERIDALRARAVGSSQQA